LLESSKVLLGLSKETEKAIKTGTQDAMLTHIKTETGVEEITMKYDTKDVGKKQKLNIGIEQTALTASKTMVNIFFQLKES